MKIELVKASEEGLKMQTSWTMRYSIVERG